VILVCVNQDATGQTSCKKCSDYGNPFTCPPRFRSKSLALSSSCSIFHFSSALIASAGHWAIVVSVALCAVAILLSLVMLVVARKTRVIYSSSPSFLAVGRKDFMCVLLFVTCCYLFSVAFGLALLTVSAALFIPEPVCCQFLFYNPQILSSCSLWGLLGCGLLHSSLVARSHRFPGRLRQLVRENLQSSQDLQQCLAAWCQDLNSLFA
jgi:hypothetical protein